MNDAQPRADMIEKYLCPTHSTDLVWRRFYIENRWKVALSEVTMSQKERGLCRRMAQCGKEMIATYV